jgi:4-aminobutyrate aminotransferase/(S)-3-amino-2-methylpropionate transaminase
MRDSEPELVRPLLGEEPPIILTPPPGPESRSWQVRHQHVAAPMGPIPEPGAPVGIVYATAQGSNVVDVDGNRYVDLAAGFGAALLGHRHPHIVRVLGIQSERLWQALGDVYPSDAKIGLCERLAALYPERGARVVLGQSGADAVTAALKTCLLATGKPGVLAFGGSYHGLSYAPLAASSLRASYSEPFASQLNPHVRFIDYPASRAELDESLSHARRLLGEGTIGAVLVEPILGRGGVVVPPAEFLGELAKLARERGALLVADEIWTGLGRAGHLLFSTANGVVPDLVCLGKGLGGGLPMSALVGRGDVMSAWRREQEVVHTSTFAGAPLAAATSVATLDVLSRAELPARSAELGDRLRHSLAEAAARVSGAIVVRGAGLMVGVDLALGQGAAWRLQQALLSRGYLTTTGGGRREVLVLTPPLTIDERLLTGFAGAFADSLRALFGG